MEQDESAAVQLPRAPQHHKRLRQLHPDMEMKNYLKNLTWSLRSQVVMNLK